MNSTKSQKKHLPPNGATIRFTVTPLASYAKTGVDYIATVHGDQVNLTNLSDGSGTFDKAWSYRFSSFEVVTH